MVSQWNGAPFIFNQQVNNNHHRPIMKKFSKSSFICIALFKTTVIKFFTMRMSWVREKNYGIYTKV